ncbi:type IV pilin protein [Nesterenkonia sedimenti]|uniref:type IV pilin protein n=1 Tax=Nesterenkonia sedimenti TaxID=1463632 RepID=UPI001B3B2654|nr:prepilin-type N-terminal cleavage/methylation domain-containing protein [Nesterenkonia sedimenti]
MRKLQRDGFTIVELMIVIVVIAILAAISIVAYTGVRERAVISSAQTDLRQLATIFEMYRLDRGQFPHNNEAIGNALDNYADVGVLGRQSLAIDGKRHLYCTKDDGSDIWINAETSSVQMEQSEFGAHQFWQGTTGRISTAEPTGSASDFPSGAEWVCTSITGGEHDVTRWSSAGVFQRQLGRQ